MPILQTSLYCCLFKQYYQQMEKFLGSISGKNSSAKHTTQTELHTEIGIIAVVDTDHNTVQVVGSFHFLQCACMCLTGIHMICKNVLQLYLVHFSHWTPCINPIKSTNQQQKNSLIAEVLPIHGENGYLKYLYNFIMDDENVRVIPSKTCG